MIDEDLVIADDLADDIGALLSTLCDGTPWNTAKFGVKDTLMTRLKGLKAIKFEGGYVRYIISRVGESYLYDVPLYKRGHLARFRGKRVRIICTDTGRFSRGYAAYAVSDTPPELIIDKLPKTVIDYQFPDWAPEQQSIYRSKRYRMIRLDCVPGKIWQKSRKEIDFSDSVWALLDGRTRHIIALGKPINESNVALHYFNPNWLSTGATFVEALKQLRKDHRWITGISYADD